MLVLVLDDEGRIVFFNQACEHTTGCAADEVVGDHVWEHFIRSEDVETAKHRLERLGREENEQRYEQYWQSRDGRRHFISWSNTVLRDNDDNVEYVLSVGTDITARRRTEEALHESEAYTRAILNTTVDAIITIGERGHIESFNHAAERIFGYEAREVMGENVHILMPDPYKTEHDSYIDNYLETGHAKIIGIGREVTGQRKDGSVFPMELAVSEVELRGRRVFTGIVRDVSERRRLEQEVLRIGDEERRRIGQDLHDGLGQMLTGIGLISRNLARRLKEQGSDLADEVADLASMVKEADEYARGLARGLVPVELEMGGLTGALERLAQNAERLFGITCTLDRQVSVPIEDTTRALHLYRIAQEALSNAVRHGKAQGVSIVLFASAEQIRLRIKDDGTGFDTSSLIALSSSASQGGMGVRIMHYRARIIGASLEVFSEEGKGATIMCTLRRKGHTPARDVKPQLREYGLRGGSESPPPRSAGSPSSTNR